MASCQWRARRATPPPAPWDSGATAIHTAATSTSRLEFHILRNRTDGITRAQMLSGRGRHARSIGGQLQVFADSAYTRDRFAGLELQLTVTGGLSSRTPPGRRHRLAVDGGLGITSERRRGDDERRFATATSALHYMWAFRTGSEFTHVTQLNADLQSGRNWRTNSETAVSVPVSRMLSLRLSNGFDFRHAPVPGFKRSDLRTTVSLVVALRRRS